LFREQSNPLHSRVVRDINYVCLLKVNISISPYKGNFLCPFQIDFRQPRLQVFPSHILLVDL